MLTTNKGHLIETTASGKVYELPYGKSRIAIRHCLTTDARMNRELLRERFGNINRLLRRPKTYALMAHKLDALIIAKHTPYFDSAMRSVIRNVNNSRLINSRRHNHTGDSWQDYRNQLTIAVMAKEVKG